MTRSNRSHSPSPHKEPAAPLDRTFRSVSLVGLFVLTLVVGSLLTVAGIFPGPLIARAYKGGEALFKQISEYQDVYSGDIWYPERGPDRGVTTYVADAAQEGLTLYVSGDTPAALLIDMDGNVVHEWRRPFSEVWDAASGGVARPRPDPFVYIRHARVLPNGDLIAIYEGNGDTPYGYGVAKLDRDSNVIWSYPGRAHHDLDISPDGNIYVLTHEIVDETLDGLRHLKPPRLDDFLVVLSPDGEELQKIPLLEAMAGSRFRQLLYTVSAEGADDPLHANAVAYIDSESAASFAFGEEGQVLLSFRALNALAVLDLESEEIVWATLGPWMGQHDPDIQPNGNIVLFDNHGNFDRPEGVSRVIEFDPRTMAIVWQYAGTPDKPLDSHIRADQQRLENGNTLITESSGGRIVEVTPEGEIAWEFVNPVRGGPHGDMIPVITWSQRLNLGEFEPVFLAQK